MSDDRWKLSFESDKKRRASVKRDGCNRYRNSKAISYFDWVFRHRAVMADGSPVPAERIRRAGDKLHEVRRSHVPKGEPNGRPPLMQAYLDKYSQDEKIQMAVTFWELSCTGPRASRLPFLRAAERVNKEFAKEIDGNIEYPLGFRAIDRDEARKSRVERFYEALITLYEQEVLIPPETPGESA